MLSCKILFVLSISSRQVNRALAFDETHYRRYCILGRLSLPPQNVSLSSLV